MAQSLSAPMDDQLMIDKLMSDLHSNVVGQRWDAANALVLCGDSAVSPLLAVLPCTDWTVRHIAIWALGELRNPAAIESLIGALTDPNLHVRLSAARALEKFDHPQARAAIQTWMQHNIAR